MFRKVSLLTAVALTMGAVAVQAQEPVIRKQPAQAAQPAQAETTRAAANAEQQGRVARVRDLIGKDVVNEQGENLGVVDDLLISRQTGTIEYVLVSESEDSDRLTPLPWTTVAWYQGEEPQEQYLIIGMQREQFQKAPVVVRQQWPTMTYTQWNEVAPRVSAYYEPVRRAEVRAVRRVNRAVRRAID